MLHRESGGVLFCEEKTGWACPELAPRRQTAWRLYTGALCAKFMDEIGDGINFALLDTMHTLPGELLDFLLAYPYLAQGALVVIHDISVYEVRALEESSVAAPAHSPCRLLFSALPGEKFLPSATEHKYLPNIGAVRLGAAADGTVDDIFGLLTLPWGYMPTDEDLETAGEAIRGHYGAEYGRQFDRTVALQREMGAVLQSRMSTAKWLVRKAYGLLRRNVLHRRFE